MLLEFAAASDEQLAGAFDVCICGGGVAGITLARKLNERGLRVMLLEGGGVAYTEESQALYQAEQTGLSCYPGTSRLRFLGGTSNHWAGRCHPFDAIDFARQSIAGLPGWPIAKSEIDAYLAEALEILDIGPGGFKRDPAPPMDAGILVPDEYAFSPPTRFGSKYLGYLQAEPRLLTLVNANLCRIELDESRRRVARVEVQALDGRKRAVSARCFVLAMGAIENARMLLASNQQVAAGVGNGSDFVGRCFMEHFNVDIGGFVLAEEFSRDGARFEYFTAPDFVEARDIGSSNLAMSFGRGYKFWGRTARLKEVIARFGCESGLAETMYMLADYRCPGEGVIRSLCEQSPNRDSRVRLSAETDRLGVPRAIVNWEMNDFDRASIRTAAMTLAKEFAKHELGRVQLSPHILDESMPIPSAHHSHHMGTTRMAASAEHGVVGPDCAVFGMDNLYVAGSSIFSTGGGCNPTLPIVQFTLRLADRLTVALART